MISIIRCMAGDFRRCWKSLFLTDIFYKIIAFILLTPLVGILLRVFMSASGNTILTDLDILYFFIHPIGWLCLILAGALWLAIAALELAALMATVASPDGQPIGLVGALRFASANAWRVIRVTARMVVYTLSALAPFLVIAGGVYWLLLTEHDINFYLNEKPPVFWIAIGIGAVLAVAVVAILLRLFTGWIFCLPLVLFEDIRPSHALRLSSERAKGHRLALLFWIVCWFAATAVLSTLATAAVVSLGRALLPRTVDSLALLTVTIGLIMLLWFIVELGVNLLSTTTFAVLHFNLYRHLGSAEEIDVSRLKPAETKITNYRLQLTGRRLVVALLAGCIAAAAIGAVTLQGIRVEDDVQIMAHRGSSESAPENTIAAVNQAIKDGADWIEIDVQETTDGKVVVFHDSDFMKVAGINLKIWDATMADLKKIDIGSWFDKKFKDERVPALGEVLEACKGKIGVNIELKYYGHDQQLEQRVADIVDKHGMAKNIVVMSLKMDAVKRMKAIRPNWKVGLLLSVFKGNLKKIDADFLAVNTAFVDRRFIRNAHATGKEIYVWTVNDPVTMSQMINAGADALITDRPALARSVLQERAAMPAPQRLLVELAEIFGH